MVLYPNKLPESERVCSGICTFNREEAKELILKECGLVMGGDIHTTLPDGEVRWNFDTHPEKQIGKITIKRR